MSARASHLEACLCHPGFPGTHDPIFARLFWVHTKAAFHSIAFGLIQSLEAYDQHLCDIFTRCEDAAHVLVFFIAVVRQAELQSKAPTSQAPEAVHSGVHGNPTECTEQAHGNVLPFVTSTKARIIGFQGDKL